MSRRLLALLCLLACTIPPARAGIYNPLEPNEGQLNPDFRVFRNTLIGIKQIAVAGLTPSPPQRGRARGAVFLLKQIPPEQLTADQALALSAYLIRLGQATEAVGLLRPVVSREPDHFLLLCNLGTAYHLIEQEQQAIDSLTRALRLWPKDWHKLSEPQKESLMRLEWNEAHFARCRQSEEYFLKLLKLRQREKQVGGKTAPIDALFEGGSPPRPLQYVGESGQYEPGKLAQAERAKLPRNALELVQQLLIWLPGDPHFLRLYYQLGELYNAGGDPATALEIFDDVTKQGGRYTGLREHGQILEAHLRSPAPPVNPVIPDKKTDIVKPPPTSTAEDSLDLPGFWRTLGVGILVGVVGALLVSWQVREILRRMKKG